MIFAKSSCCFSSPFVFEGRRSDIDWKIVAPSISAAMNDEHIKLLSRGRQFSISSSD
jgi:hypothetical protein